MRGEHHDAFTAHKGISLALIIVAEWMFQGHQSLKITYRCSNMYMGSIGFGLTLPYMHVCEGISTSLTNHISQHDNTLQSESCAQIREVLTT